MKLKSLGSQSSRRAVPNTLAPVRNAFNRSLPVQKKPFHKLAIMGVFAFSGRFLFVVLFLASGAQKLIQTPPLGDGYSESALVQSKLNTFTKTVKDHTGFVLPLEKVIVSTIFLTCILCLNESIYVDLQQAVVAIYLFSRVQVVIFTTATFSFASVMLQGHTQYLLIAAIALELVGAVLFLWDSSLGALLLVKPSPLRLTQANLT